MPTDVYRSCPRAHSVGRLRSVSTSSTRRESPEAKRARGVYKSYSLKQKIEIVNSARKAGSEASASAKYGVPRSTIYY